MSQLTQVKAACNQIATTAKSTAGSLSAFKSKFSQQVGEVQQAIGGSARNVDKQLVQTLQQAQKQVEAAAQALQQAAQAASSYGQSI